MQHNRCESVRVSLADRDVGEAPHPVHWVKANGRYRGNAALACKAVFKRSGMKGCSPMYSMTNLLFALLVGGAIGGAIGWYWAMSARGDNKRRLILDLETQLEQASQSRADYEAEVAEHFSQTADLLHKLTDDYRAVYTHLADGLNNSAVIKSISPRQRSPHQQMKPSHTLLKSRSHLTTRPKNPTSKDNYQRPLASINPIPRQLESKQMTWADLLRL